MRDCDCGDKRHSLLGLGKLVAVVDLMQYVGITRAKSLSSVSCLLLPPSTASQNYSLRQRAHSLQLPERSTHLSDCDFLMRMMYKNSY